MQVSVEELEGLERRLNVQVPADQIDKEVEGRLHKLSRQARIDGFRPGKVPFKVVKRMYGSQVRQEVIGEVLQSSLREAITQENLRPAGGPRIDSLNAEEGNSLEYSATFEIMPEFDAKDIEDLTIERPLAQVTEADVDKMIETLREQRAEWDDVERPARLKDRVTIAYEGKLDGEDFPGNKDDQTELVLGSGTMIEGFEQQLVGCNPGAEVEFDITFPQDYQVRDLAGKEVRFEVRVQKVAEPRLPDVDDEFASSFGVSEGGIEKLRAALRDNMERELSETIKNSVKQKAMDGLLAANDILVPAAMVDDEIESLAKQSGIEKEQQDERVLKARKGLFETTARRRVALGLIVSRLVAMHEIKLDDARVQKQLENIASSYEDPEAVVRWYRQNPRLMESVQTLVMEDQVVEWLLDRANVVDKPSSFDEVMKPAREQSPAPELAVNQE